jgi:hypothetical protein
VGTYIESFSKVQKDTNTVHVIIDGFSNIINNLQQILLCGAFGQEAVLMSIQQVV